MRLKWTKQYVALLCIVFTICGTPLTTASAAQDQGNSGSTTHGSGDAVKELDWTFGAASQGGFWHLLASTIATEVQDAMLQSTITVIESGSIANLLGVNANKFQIGFTNSETLNQGLESSGEFEGREIDSARWIATMFSTKMNIAVKEGSDINSVSGLKGKRVSPGIKGYGTEASFGKIMEFNGFSYDDIQVEYTSTADAVNLLRDGHIDALATNGGTPIPALMELDATLGIRLIGLSDETISKMTAFNAGFSRTIIPAGTYESVNQDIQTISSSTLLVGNKSLSNEAVYQFTKTLFENAKALKNVGPSMSDFSAKYSASKRMGTVHPGAMKYYKEAGLIE